MDEQIIIKPISLLRDEKAFEGIRLYDGKPSITTVLKILKDSDSFEQFKQHDMQGFKDMMKRKADMGTQLHESIHQTYLTGNYKSPPVPHSKAWLNFYTKEGWKRKHTHLEHFVSAEDVAGTCDFIGRTGGEKIYLVDRKSVGSRVYDELIFKYKMQVSKYATIHNATADEKISHGRIVCFSSQGWYRVIEIANIQYYSDLYDEVLKQFYILREQYAEIQSRAGGVQEGSLQGQGQRTDSYDKVSTNEIVNDMGLITEGI